MRFLTTRAFLACLITLLASDAMAADDGSSASLQQQIARALRPSIDEDQRRLGELAARLKTLPPLAPGSRGASAGYHSRFHKSADATVDIVLDLGALHPIDRVAIFSVSAVSQGETVPRYGFPQRFRLEAAPERDFEQATTIIDSTRGGPQVRPKYPVQSETPGLSARFLRLRVLQQWKRGDGRYLTALGEIMVLSGGRNVAIGARVEAESFTSLPDWSLENLVDGQADLGLPIGPERSLTNGFLSRSQRVPETSKWVQLDLGHSSKIEEVRLIPATPFDAPNQHGHGFPRRFRVLVSSDPEFTAPIEIADHTEFAFPNPGDNPIVLTADSTTARYVRLEVEELWHISQRFYSLALAEVQVYEGGRNIATDATVTVSDSFTKSPFDLVWQPAFLVDGYSSQNRLIELDQWLEGLAERADTQNEIDRIEARVQRTVEGTANALLVLAAALVAALAAFTLATLVRRKRALIRQRDEMRARIARDLHDDLGSRLGGMRLISESMLASPELPVSMFDDLQLIHRASREATDAMRDIVWLLDNSETSRSKLISHIREMTPAILGGVSCEFITDDTPDQQLDFDFRRHVLFAFKECLGNAAKHAEAKHVHCHIGGGLKRFTFEVSDDGEGFLVAAAGGGHGLKNLRDRGEALGGSVSVSSRPGEGTKVVFDVPVKTRSSG